MEYKLYIQCWQARNFGLQKKQIFYTEYSKPTIFFLKDSLFPLPIFPFNSFCLTFLFSLSFLSSFHAKGPRIFHNVVMPCVFVFHFTVMPCLMLTVLVLFFFPPDLTKVYLSRLLFIFQTLSLFLIVARDNLVFMQNWFLKFPQYRNRSLFITGESYAGIFCYSKQINSFSIQDLT